VIAQWKREKRQREKRQREREREGLFLFGVTQLLLAMPKLLNKNLTNSEKMQS
jgi:hypothetical protein